MYRKATLNDCEKVYNLICDMERKQLPLDKFCSIYREQINNRHYYCLVCEYDNNVIGVLNLRFEEQLHHSACIAEIMEFAVDEAYRKQGIGLCFCFISFWIKRNMAKKAKEKLCKTAETKRNFQLF